MRLRLYALGRISRLSSVNPATNLNSGSKNLKPDALSRQFEPSEKYARPETILPTSRVLATILWDLKTAVCTQEKPNCTSLTQVMALGDASLFLCVFVPRCYSGHMLTPPQDTRGLLEPANWARGGFGGPECREISGPSSPPAAFVHRTRSQGTVLKVCCTHYLSQDVPGPTFLWTSSPGYLSRKGTPLS